MKSRVIKTAVVMAIVLAALAVITLIVLRNLYPQKYSDTVVKYADEYSLPPELVFAMIKCESNFDKNAVSHADARGLMQITPQTLEWAAGGNKFTENSLFDPATNIRYGCVIMSRFCDEFGDTAVALSAYNAGRSRTAGWLSDPDHSSDGKTLDSIPYPETARYVNKVLATKRIYEIIY